MLGDLLGDAWHVGRLPGEGVLVGAEEVDERELLFGREQCSDPDSLGQVGGVNGDCLGFLSWEESATGRRLAGVGATLGDGYSEPG